MPNNQFFKLKWQTNDKFISFERISNCDWQEKNNFVSANLSFVSFSNTSLTLTLFDNIRKKFVILNNQSYSEGKDLNLLDFMDNGEWVDTFPKKTYFKDTETCEFNG